ncbi:MAG: S41 family peptidase, partial [Bacteroidota bacterium]
MHFDSSNSPFRRWWSQLSAKNLGFNIRSWAKVRILTWALLLGAGGLALNNNYFELSKHIEIFTTLYREINTYYVDDVDPAKLMKTGIDAMLKSLDPYTDYIPESEIENFKFMTTGQYGGIGALISQNGESIMIADPYEGFPAQKADLRAGDQLLR